MSHFVSTGDSAWSIAIQYGLTLEQLLAYNNLTDDAILRPGDELWIRRTLTPIATPTSEVTPTAVPITDTVALAVMAPSATFTPPPPSPTHTPAPVPTATATAVTASTNWSQTLYRSSIAASLGLMILAGVVIFAMRKELI
jgi:hypothetical protein